MDGLGNSVTTDGDVVRDLYINEESEGSNGPFILFLEQKHQFLCISLYFRSSVESCYRLVIN